MPLPVPEPGLVISYAYLWQSEAERGVTEGRKTRPAVIVLAVDTDGAGSIEVVVVAVTHAAPSAGIEALELTQRVKRSIGLDADRSWIILDEVNRFAWPGYDLREVPGERGAFAYGVVPRPLYEVVKARVLELASARRLKAVVRD